MNRQTRVLLPWLSESEAITSLLGHLPVAGEAIESQRILFNNARDFLLTRDPYSLLTPIIMDFPRDLQTLSAQFCQRPDVVAAMQGLDWSVGIADLREVLSFQKIVNEEQALERANSVNLLDPQSLFSFCLPESGSETILHGALDLDQRGITLSSLNPNLRVGTQLGADVTLAAVPGGAGRKEKLIGFTINFGANFIQIAEYKERWFVRDGYHRTFGLLRRGVHQIPCIFIKARNFQELGASNPGFFPYEALFGDRPPFLTDFLDDRLSVSVSQKAVRKIVRISAEEFVVEV